MFANNICNQLRTTLHQNYDETVVPSQLKMFISFLLESLQKHEVPTSVQLFFSSTILLRMSLRFFHLASQDVDIRMQDTEENRALVKGCPSLFEYNPRYGSIYKINFTFFSPMLSSYSYTVAVACILSTVLAINRLACRRSSRISLPGFSLRCNTTGSY